MRNIFDTEMGKVRDTLGFSATINYYILSRRSRDRISCYYKRYMCGEKCIILMGTKKNEKGLLIFNSRQTKIYQTLLIYDKKARGSSNTNDLCSFLTKWREENVSILYPQSTATLLVKDTPLIRARIHIKRTNNFDLQIVARSFNFIMYYLYIREMCGILNF